MYNWEPWPQKDPIWFHIYLHICQSKQSKNLLPVEVWAPSDCVVSEVFLALFIAKVLQWIRPKQIAHRPERRGLLKPVQLGHNDKNIIQNTEIHHFPVAMHEISVLPHMASLFMHGLAVPSLCRLNSGFPGTVHRGHTGTVGSWAQPRADSQTRPYRSHKPALNTWFYLKHNKGDKKQINTKIKYDKYDVCKAANSVSSGVWPLIYPNYEVWESIYKMKRQKWYDFRSTTCFCR